MMYYQDCEIFRAALEVLKKLSCSGYIEPSSKENRSVSYWIISL